MLRGRLTKVRLPKLASQAKHAIRCAANFVELHDKTATREHPRVAFCHAHRKGPRPLPRAYPRVLATIGDHLRKRRLDLGLLQGEVADRLGVTESSVTNWELSRTEPELRFLPGIVR